MKIGLRKCIGDKSQSGHALLLAAMLGTLVFALWQVAYRATADAEGMDASAPQRLVRMEALPSAVARAGRLLRTGPPPSSPFKCVYSHYIGPGNTQEVTLEFRRKSGNDRWQVEASLSTKKEARRLPTVPLNF